MEWLEQSMRSKGYDFESLYSGSIPVGEVINLPLGLYIELMLKFSVNFTNLFVSETDI